jgi:hypothetical protein
VAAGLIEFELTRSRPFIALRVLFAGRAPS